MNRFVASRQQLFEIIREKVDCSRREQQQHLYEYVIKKIEKFVSMDDNDKQVKRTQDDVSRFVSKVYQKWDICRRNLTFFLAHNAEWLNGEVVFEILKEYEEPQKVGRPTVAFELAADRTKRLKTEHLRKGNTALELLYAASMQLRTEGFEHAAKLVQIICDSPHKATEILNRYKDEKLPPKKLCPAEGVSLIIEADLSRAQYCLLKSVAKHHHADIFPSYHEILDTKKKSYPPSDKITINEESAEVDLQTLLDFDATRLEETLKECQNMELLTSTNEYEFLHKWGCDGSGGQAIYKQAFSDEKSSDGSMLLTAIVPLQLRVLDRSDVLWTNPSPASTRFCKPLRIQFAKETKHSLIQVEENFKNQISKFHPSIVWVGDGHCIKVHHRLTMTMIDGKARNMLTDTSSMATCCACGATPSKMAVESVIQRPVKTSVFTYGISVLHSRIRFFECLLHVAYKIDIKKWSAKQDDYKERKYMIQEALRRELGILVDTVKQGSGSTNDGNTARRFFEHPSEVAAITGLNEDIIVRFSIILNTLACSFAIDPEIFKQYALKTALLFEQNYPWYYMPASVHYVLIHGADIIASLDLPMGLYSEEALEARNKNIRSFREHRTRKMSREATMSDLFYRLWITGDILFSSLRKYEPKDQEELADSVRSLLL